MTKIFALVDCNNFFASCEKIFNPKLINKPVIVLSNNDGCVIARSNEAKVLGIKMGEPYFKVKELCEQHLVEVFSSNYQLYGDMSQRVMSVLAKFTPNFEIYSIDEAFLDLTGFDKNELNQYLEDMVNIIQKWLGISVSIGVGPTKTLAKVANYYAKKNNSYGGAIAPSRGICNLMHASNQEILLDKINIEDIWGIGSKWSVKMRSLGIGTASELARSDPKFIRKNFSVIGERIVYELNGTSCLEMETIQNKKSITASRSFCMPISDLSNLEEAISEYASRAAIKLREQSSFAGGVYIYLKVHDADVTKIIKGDNSSYQGITKLLEIPTNNTAKLVSAAKKSLAQIYQKNIRYKKAGIILLDLVERNMLQENLFYSPINKREQVLLEMMDSLNNKMRGNVLSFAATGTKKPWQMKRDFCSNRYTTSWNELPLVS